jgi:L-rhamnose isomerase
MITEEMIEFAAKALAEYQAPNAGWAYASEELRDAYRNEVRVILEIVSNRSNRENADGNG